MSGDIFIGIADVPDRDLHTITRLQGEIVYKTILIFQILNNTVCLIDESRYLMDMVTRPSPFFVNYASVRLKAGIGLLRIDNPFGGF